MDICAKALAVAKICQMYAAQQRERERESKKMSRKDGVGV